MTLQVAFDQFADTVKRLLKHEEAYVAAHTIGSIATSAKLPGEIVVAAVTRLAPDAASKALKDAGLAIFQGTWLTPEEVMTPEINPIETFIAAVSYRSSGDKAGVWVDAYPALPTQVSVLKEMYDEFRETGELPDVTFEEFVAQANPNVVIVSPADIEAFLKQKETSESDAETRLEEPADDSLLTAQTPSHEPE
ncbi:MAG TPA: hypothetical protein VMI31_03100 [Fimbriimonadaceae bacterium]|nr:hypothetical protein [Fimbriimonadaceae bacterium]